jgi:hypothetical protein
VGKRLCTIIVGKYSNRNTVRKADWPPALVRRPGGAPLAREARKMVPKSGLDPNHLFEELDRWTEVLKHLKPVTANDEAASLPARKARATRSPRKARMGEQKVAHERHLDPQSPTPRLSSDDVRGESQS